MSHAVTCDFSKETICAVASLCCLEMFFVFVFFGHWDWKMVGAGTLVSMFYVGFIVRVFSGRISWLDRIFIPSGPRAVPVSVAGADTWGGHRVVTIARMYGSGGNGVGGLWPAGSDARATAGN